MSSKPGFTELKRAHIMGRERKYLQYLLEEFSGNVHRAAKAAQVDRGNFQRLLRRHRIRADAFRGAKR